jgi:hypothetical protein
MKTVNPVDAARRRYFVEFGTAMVAYVLIVLASTYVCNTGIGNPLRTIVALTPLLPMVVVFVAIVRYLLSIDELQRQIHVESAALAAGIVALLSLTYGFLETVGFPKPSSWFTYSALMIAWGISLPFVSRRYK